MATNTDVLRAVPLFAGMTERSLTSIAELAREATYDPASVIVREGEPGESFVVIVNGGATVEQDGRTVNLLGPGDFLGEIALIDGRPRTANRHRDRTHRALVDRPSRIPATHGRAPVVRHDLVSALTQRLRQRAPTRSTDPGPSIRRTRRRPRAASSTSDSSASSVAAESRTRPITRLTPSSR